MIECNTNPCLELSSPLLTKMIPHLIDNTFRIALDPILQPPKGFSTKKSSVGNEICPENRYELIFDERVEGDQLRELFAANNNG